VEIFEFPFVYDVMITFLSRSIKKLMRATLEMLFMQSCPHIMIRMRLKTAQASRVLQSVLCVCVCVVNEITRQRHSFRDTQD